MAYASNWVGGVASSGNVELLCDGLGDCSEGRRRSLGGGKSGNSLTGICTAPTGGGAIGVLIPAVAALASADSGAALPDDTARDAWPLLPTLPIGSGDKGPSQGFQSTWP